MLNIGTEPTAQRSLDFSSDRYLICAGPVERKKRHFYHITKIKPPFGTMNPREVRVSINVFKTMSK